MVSCDRSPFGTPSVRSDWITLTCYCLSKGAFLGFRFLFHGGERRQKILQHLHEPHQPHFFFPSRKKIKSPPPAAVELFNGHVPLMRVTATLTQSNAVRISKLSHEARTILQSSHHVDHREQPKAPSHPRKIERR